MFEDLDEEDFDEEEMFSYMIENGYVEISGIDPNGEFVYKMTRKMGQHFPEIFEEHLFTESLTITLRNAINTIPQNVAQSGPKILLTTFPQETHGLGLLMAEAMFALEGAHCLSLGIQTPILDIVRAAASQHCEVIALSFSACLNANLVIDGLAELRHHLPADIQIWAGGSCPVLHRRPPQGIIVLPSLESASRAVSQWRQHHSDIKNKLFAQLVDPL